MDGALIFFSVGNGFGLIAWHGDNRGVNNCLAPVQLPICWVPAPSEAAGRAQMNAPAQPDVNDISHTSRTCGAINQKLIELLVDYIAVPLPASSTARFPGTMPPALQRLCCPWTAGACPGRWHMTAASLETATPSTQTKCFQAQDVYLTNIYYFQ